MRLGLSVLVALSVASTALAASIAPRPGWVVLETRHSYEDLVKRIGAAVKANGMIVVTRAGPTKAAARRGITIPGNLVMGVYNNDFAVRALGFSTAAMIEAPIRIYVTEDEGGTATLSYKTPTLVFTPYFEDGGQGLRDLASELDAKFEAIAEAASE
ncbi:MAG: DUF302 domain-containing protein [Pseudomonadota bacterium]